MTQERAYLWHLVSDRCGVGVLDAGGLCHGGGGIYQGKKLGKYFNEKFDGLLHRNRGIYPDWILASSWGGSSRTDWKTRI